MQSKLLKEALNENTPPQRLAELANSEDKTIRRTIAVNPNTPVTILKELFKDFPLEIFENPVLSLLLLENPDFFYELYQAHSNIFLEQGLPEFFIAWGVKHSNKEVRIAVARSPQTPQEFLEKLAFDSNYNVRCRVAENVKTPIDLLEYLAQDFDYRVRLAVAENIYTPKQSLEKLSSDSEYLVRLIIAKNPHTPQDTLLSLIHDKNDSIRFAAYNNLEDFRF